MVPSYNNTMDTNNDNDKPYSNHDDHKLQKFTRVLPGEGTHFVKNWHSLAELDAKLPFLKAPT